MPRKRPGLLHVGIKGHVLAVDRDSGTEVWRTKLQGVRMRATDFVHLHRDEHALYASFSGELFCLDPATGEVRWHNQLTGLGTGVVSLLSDVAPVERSAPVSLIEQQRRVEASRRSAAT